MKKYAFLTASIILALTSPGICAESPSVAAIERPNILWIYLEDVSRWFGCYGDKLAETPNIDRLAKTGVRFDRFYTCAGVCSAMRSGTVTGMMQTSIGAHQHRSHRNVRIGEYVDSHQLPRGIKTVPEYFRAAGYYTFNDGKDDYNFDWSKDNLYDSYGAMNFQGDEWANCPKDKPFFGQIQLKGGKDRPPFEDAEKVDRAAVPVPPYYPDIPLVREEIAHHYDCIKWTDQQVGMIVEQLKKDGIYDKTIVLLLSDHGYKLHRDKQFLYEGGINMAFVVAGPGIASGEVRSDLVSSIDVGPTSLALAGIEVPKHMEGRFVFASDYQPREFVVAARDRCDYTIEHIRAVVTPKYKYLRNFLTDRPFMQPSYKDPWPVSQELRRMMAANEMNATQMLFFGAQKPSEELYDLTKDPHEVNNIAGDPKYAEVLAQHRQLLSNWMQETDDQGQYPESDAALLAVLKEWRSRCVNPEYDRVRGLVDLGPEPKPRKKK
ncbi:MAG: sulfatase [Planctomycetaceae bacterium]|nr:sulfatase [Planctomycetales bacterium]MCB9927595.1 sulfatase [Planctomycetaceae bacterium]